MAPPAYSQWIKWWTKRIRDIYADDLGKQEAARNLVMHLIESISREEYASNEAILGAVRRAQTQLERDYPEVWNSEGVSDHWW